MSARICMCCGELMAEKGDAHSLNSNICTACSSLPDGVSEFSMSSFPDFDGKTLVEVDFHQVMAEPLTAFARS